MPEIVPSPVLACGQCNSSMLPPQLVSISLLCLLSSHYSLLMLLSQPLSISLLCFSISAFSL